MLEALERELVIAKQHEAAELDETGGQAKLNVPTKSSNKDQIYKSTLSSTPSNENDPRSEWNGEEPDCCICRLKANPRTDWQSEPK